MKILPSAILAAATCMALPTHATDGLSVSTGIDYSTGKYGASASTDILSLPVAIKYTSGPAIFSVTVPWIEINRQANATTNTALTVGDEELVLVTSAANAGLSSKASGMGDIVSAATYNIVFDAANSFLVDMTGKIKLATADQNKGLGTGKNDYAMQLDLYKTMGQVSLLTTLGYKWMGKPGGSDFHNVGYASAGMVYKFDDDISAGAIFDFRQSVLSASAAKRELMLYASRHLSRSWKLQGYVLAGMSTSSPDTGVGALIGYSF